MARTKRRNLAVITALNAHQLDKQPDEQPEQKREEEIQEQEMEREQLDGTGEDWEGLDNAVDLDNNVDDQGEKQGEQEFEEVIVEQRICFLIPPLPPRKRREVARRERFRQQELAAKAENGEKVNPAGKTRKIVDVMEAPPPPPPPPSHRGNVSVIQPPSTNAIDTKLRYIKKKLKRSGGLSLWLVSKGLAKFAPVFQRHKIREEDLIHLTIDALKRIGVDRVGPRRKLISAIQQLSGIV